MKNYYWLKLKSDFFDEDTIAYLEEQENGIVYSNFYLKLCLKSLKSEGKLIRFIGDTLIPYDYKSIAKLTNVDINIVIVAMELFKKLGLVKVLETGEIFISQLQEMVGKETIKAELMRKKRAKDKLLKCSNNVTLMLPKCYTEIEIDKEIDKEIEDGLTDKLNNIYNYLNNEKLVQDITKKYDSIFKLLNVYIDNISYIPINLVNKTKLYQICIKRLVDTNQTNILEKINESILDKVFGQIVRADIKESIIEYYIKSLTNEFKNDRRNTNDK